MEGKAEETDLGEDDGHASIAEGRRWDCGIGEPEPTSQRRLCGLLLNTLRTAAPISLLHNTCMDESCDICGHNGEAEFLVTCSKCKISCEHIYCRRIILGKIPDDWVCESCLEGDKVTGQTVAPSIYQGTHSKSRCQRTVQSGKVKFIPSEEVIKLTTGAPYKSKIAVAQRNRVGTKSLKSIYSSSRKVNPTVDRVKVSKDANERITTTCQQLSRASMSCEGCANVKHKYSDYEDRDLLDVLPEIYQYRAFLPALHVVWKGQIVFRDTVTTGECFGEFQAQPPCRVHGKAYNASKNLPPVLQVQLLPESKANLFLDDSLHLHDIALYFSSSDHIERLKQKNSSVFDQLEIHSSILRSYFNGVELLIFASKHLHHDSQKIISKLIGDRLLLGVFRPTKKDKVASRECKAVVSPAGRSQIWDTKAKIEAVDKKAMKSNKDEVEFQKCKAIISPAGQSQVWATKAKFEAKVDEVGEENFKELIKLHCNVCKSSYELFLQKQTGKNSLISRLDAAINKQKLKSKLQEPKERDESLLVAKKIKEETENELPLKSFSKSSSNAEDKMDYPPGFEKRRG